MKPSLAAITSSSSPLRRTSSRRILRKS
uniref:Uncharacterized protein n=1 Tax=Arundo donax TaxID=35708 RepID=A0A0A9H8K1_ARUDO